MADILKERGTIVVTGGSGFVGATLARRLVRLGHEVHVFKKHETDTSRLADVLPQLTVHEDDLTNVKRLEATVARLRPRGVFHCAAANIQSGVGAESRLLLETNVLGIVNLLTALAPIEYDFCVNVGSFLEYGNQAGALRETDVPKPGNIYAISKLAGTLYAQSVGREEQRPVVTLRLMTPYGPGIQKGRLIYEVLRSALRNEPIRLTTPNVVRDFIFVEDFAALCLAVASSARALCGEIFNAGSGLSTTLKTVVEIACRVTDSTSAVEWGGFPAVAYDSDALRADMTKTNATFTWRPEVTLEEGIRRTVEWMQHERIHEKGI
jgi:dTDP-glucose 4,6-dehydratase